MELLRIFAMFLVLLVHADFFSLGAPSVADCVAAPFDSAIKVYFEAISIACVDIFVCLSGWFGIRASIKGFSNFIFQCFFWLIGLYVVTLILGTSALSYEGIKGCFVLTKLNWFIKAYILLYVLSPVLNAFVEKASQKEFKNVLIGFFIFEFVYGWLFPASTAHIQSGYSTISFIGLYLLVRYIRTYQHSFMMMPKLCYVLFIIVAPVGLTICYCTPPLVGIDTTIFGSVWINYISPYSIALALATIVLFSKVNIYSRFINWIAASSFAVFLIHTNPNTLWYFRDFFISLYNQLTFYIFWPFTFGVLILLFAVAVLIDQLRIFIWNMLWKQFEKQNDSDIRQS